MLDMYHALTIVCFRAHQSHSSGCILRWRILTPSALQECRKLQETHFIKRTSTLVHCAADRNVNNSNTCTPLLILPNRSTLLRLLTQLSLRHLLQPPLLPLNLPDPPIRLTLIPPKQHVPVLQPRHNLLPCTSQLLRTSILAFTGRQWLPRFRSLFVFLTRTFFKLRVYGHVHLLHAAHIRDRVFGETPRDECARSVLACEEVVRAAWSVRRRGDGDIVDCAVYSEEDGFSGVGAVVGCEFGVGEGEFALLFTIRLFFEKSERGGEDYVP
jgi:hypothetical protein